MSYDRILKLAINFHKLVRIAYSFAVLGALTNEMRNAMGVSLDTSPFESGANSAVFINNRNNIVAYSDYDKLYSVAERAKGLDTDVLPQIYDVQKFEVADDSEQPSFLGKDYIFAVEMEQLKMLNGDGNIFEKYKKEIFEAGETPENVNPGEQQIVSAMLDLRSRSQRDNIKHIDIWSGNVGWDAGGSLKFIDFEAVEIGQFGSGGPSEGGKPEEDKPPEELTEEVIIPEGGLFG